MKISRRNLLRGSAAASSLMLTGCDAIDRLSNTDNAVRKVLASANELTYRAQRLLLGDDWLAREYSESDIRQPQKPNGTESPDDEDYKALASTGFADYRLEVAGMVEKPQRFSLENLRAMPTRTQITRHDCVEGWSCIAKWSGVQLSRILDEVKVKPDARYVVFRCFDTMEQGLSGPVRYYGSIDLIDARHPQTILAFDLNGKPLPTSNGAPIRLRVERQLGYKMNKYVRAIELVSSYASIGDGKGGYWEDQGYDWYAGI
ncbi:molybdopterin-binding protein [Bradyrhizobium sp.]|uniref:molybdopterin-binding protein n=1 Tax=Bradyrhizobium sp. TaxID=376 RepID=UPI003C39D544